MTVTLIENELQQLERNCVMPHKYQKILRVFYEGVRDALDAAHQPQENFLKQFLLFLHLIEEQFRSPYSFHPYHRKIRDPLDYYRFGLEFVRPLIDQAHSKVFGEEVLQKIEQQILAGENVILLANHQTETDPQAISILLEKAHPLLGEELIYVAGERVVTDPLAIPFSMGCNLLCIYSKRYIDHPPELKAKKQLHNKHTMERMSQLLSEGGRAIYVAPSGGRDRRNEEGVVEVARFDSQSLEMLSLMAKKSKRATHFYPLILDTYELLPPPDHVQHELGELRIAKFTPIQLSFLAECDMGHSFGVASLEKSERRRARAEAIWSLVDAEYRRLIKNR
jgi:glycerol-3-phosphate O-acyltransferase